MKRLIWIAGFVAAFAVPTLAQQASELNIKVSTQEIEVIAKGLGKLPYEEVAALFNKLRAQVVDQQVPRKEDVKPEVK